MVMLDGLQPCEPTPSQPVESRRAQRVCMTADAISSEECIGLPVFVLSSSCLRLVFVFVVVSFHVLDWPVLACPCPCLCLLLLSLSSRAGLTEHAFAGGRPGRLFPPPTSFGSWRSCSSISPSSSLCLALSLSLSLSLYISLSLYTRHPLYSLP